MPQVRLPLPVFVLAFVCAITFQADAARLKVAVVQTVIEDTLQENCEKLLRFIDQAQEAGCRLTIFPEGALYYSEIATEHPTKADLDSAIERIGKRARRAGMTVVFGTEYKSTEDGKYQNRGVVYDPSGARRVFYKKNMEVPQPFPVDGVACNFLICSDRGYLEHSDLPCLVQGTQVIIDISGGHGGDDGRPDLRWIRYRPWALRTGAFVMVSNPVHGDTDFMGHCPWGGGSAIIRPDGSIQASLIHQKDTMIVEEIDTELAARTPAERRRNHPIFKSFWDMGKTLLEGGVVEPVPAVKPYSSASRSVKIAAVQMACSRDIDRNVDAMLRHIAEAASEKADIVVFPELAVTGGLEADIRAATEPALRGALERIRIAARSSSIFVIFGMPALKNERRRNCAYVIGSDGGVETRYDQIGVPNSGPFEGGTDVKTMWFAFKGVPAIVTIGADADWIELADLAANRGMILHFHITYETDPSADAAILRTQRNLLLLTYARYGVVVNAADPSGLANPSTPAGGRSMIVSREGGHNKPAPQGLEYYLPYQTSIITGAERQETILYATRKTPGRNDMDLATSWSERRASDAVSA